MTRNTLREGVGEEWGCWEQADRWRREAFQRRSPAERLAWLEDLLRLRQSAVAARANRSPAKTPSPP